MLFRSNPFRRRLAIGDDGERHADALHPPARSRSDAGAGSGVTAFRRRWRLWRIGPRNKSGVTENRRLPSLRAPAADGASNDLIFLPDLAPQFGEQRIARGPPLVLLALLAADADRARHPFAADPPSPVPGP